jgi:hypothetical protein
LIPEYITLKMGNEIDYENVDANSLGTYKMEARLPDRYHIEGGLQDQDKKNTVRQSISEIQKLREHRLRTKRKKRHAALTEKVVKSEQIRALKKTKRGPTKIQLFNAIDDETVMKLIIRRTSEDYTFRSQILRTIGPGIIKELVFGSNGTQKKNVSQALAVLSDDGRTLDRYQLQQYDAHHMRMLFTKEARTNNLTIKTHLCDNMKVCIRKDLQNQKDKNEIIIDCAHDIRCPRSASETIRFNPTSGLPILCEIPQVAITKIRHKIAMLKMETVLFGSKCVESSLSQFCKSEIYDKNLWYIIKDFYE